MDDLEQLARSIAASANASQTGVVLAESCTAGLAANALSQVPGASRWFCGSMVVYQTETKSAWLQVPSSILDDPARGPVSRDAAAAMCAAVMTRTPQATLAASVTGHLGPNAPPDLDGLIFVGIQRRQSSTAQAPAPQVSEHRLPLAVPPHAADVPLRFHRQRAAALILLRRILDALPACGES
jgi:PncC family amidohydrolase